MGIFSSWHRANDFDLTAEDLATCEGYVTAEAFRKLQAAKASARSDAGGVLYALARQVATNVIEVVAGAMNHIDRAAASTPGPTDGAATTKAQGAPAENASVATSAKTASTTSPQATPADHIDKAA